MVILDNALLLSPFAARCVLNMKKAGDRGRNAGTDYILSPISTMRYTNKSTTNPPETLDTSHSSFILHTNLDDV